MHKNWDSLEVHSSHIQYLVTLLHDAIFGVLALPHVKTIIRESSNWYALN